MELPHEAERKPLMVAVTTGPSDDPDGALLALPDGLGGSESKAYDTLAWYAMA